MLTKYKEFIKAKFSLVIQNMMVVNYKEFIKPKFSLVIQVTCLAFVSWQSMLCIAKYLDHPQGTKMSLYHTDATNQFPTINICKDLRFHPYDENRLTDCGIR